MNVASREGNQIIYSHRYSSNHPEFKHFQFKIPKLVQIIMMARGLGDLSLFLKCPLNIILNCFPNLGLQGALVTESGIQGSQPILKGLAVQSGMRDVERTQPCSFCPFIAGEV